MLEHGGRLRTAAARWGVPLGDWLDLSTGVGPLGYPLPPAPADCWRRLPEDGDGLEAVASAYYGTPALLALPGSQAAIQALPRLRPPGVAAVLAPGYGEYAASWRAAGHDVRAFAAVGLEAAAAGADVVMLGNPNNPDGTRFGRARLLAVARMLAGRGGWLVVDEAFADADPEESLAGIAGSTEAGNLIVLRSLGKFFGLAGARVGFALGAADLLDRLRVAVGPWAVAGPSRWAARLALADHAWQAAQRERLASASRRLAQLLCDFGLNESSGAALFRYLRTPHADAMFESLARRGILVRRFTQPQALRFGLPGGEAEWQRLTEALAVLR